VLVLWSLGAGLSHGEEVDAETLRVRGSSGPYCGVLTLYSAARLLNHEIDVVDLLKPEYIGSREGSSLGELEQAAHDIGLQAAIIRNASLRELRSTDLPMILHVSTPETPTKYDHYVLCAFSDGRSAWVFDPPVPPRKLPLEYLLPYWDRYALIVSDKPIDVSALSASSRRLTFSVVLTLIAAVMAMRCISHISHARRPTRIISVVFRSLLQALSIAILGTAAGITYHFFVSGGLLANTSLTDSIVSANASTFLTKVSAAQAHELIARREVVFLDARLPHDFARGHIDGALNVPVSISADELDSVLRDLSPDLRYVVYCQSAGCRYADAICRRLVDHGYDNVALFRGGWQEWLDTLPEQ
jgi:rhodanese-related sulfurtransferase